MANELYIEHKKSKKVHIVHDSIVGGMYDSYCGLEVSKNNSKIVFPNNYFIEDLCRKCVSRFKIKNGHNPSWIE